MINLDHIHNFDPGREAYVAVNVCNLVIPMLEFRRADSKEEPIGGYDRLFAMLGTDADEAGRNYQLLRTKLISYFECRKCVPAEDHADEVLHRVAEKFESGEKIEDVIRYSFGVARFVRLESYRVRPDLSVETAGTSAGSVNDGAVPPELRVEPKIDLLENDSVEILRRNCLRICLLNLSDVHRQLLLEYYHTDESRKQKDHRRRLAKKYEKTAGALQKQICLLRQKVGRCTKECIGNGAP